MFDSLAMLLTFGFKVSVYPSTIYFYSLIPAKSGGATPVLRSDVLYNQVKEMHPQFVQDLEEKGLCYTRVLPAKDDPMSAIGRSWKSTFQTEDKKVAETKAKDLGVSLKWLDNGIVTTILPSRICCNH